MSTRLPPDGESRIKTPMRKRVGRSAGRPQATTSGFEWRDPESVPGAILSSEVQRKLQADLAEIDACQRRAWVSARNYVIY